MRSGMFAVFLAAVFAAAAAMNCTGEIKSSYDGDVYVRGKKTCYIRDGVKISGSVYMSEGANLETTGKVEIQGSFGILGAEAGYLNIGGNLKVEKIDMFNGTDVSHIYITGATVGFGGLKLEGSTGDLVICDSIVHDVLEYKECKGNFVSHKDWYSIPGWIGCGSNKFTGDVKIDTIDGDVTIVDSDAERGELNIKGTTGKVLLKDMDVKIAKIESNQGKVYLEDLEGYEGEIKENIGGVEMYDVEFKKLNCVDNVGVTGNDNEIDYPQGQCTGKGFLDDDDDFFDDDYFEDDLFDDDDDGFFGFFNRFF